MRQSYLAQGNTCTVRANLCSLRGNVAYRLGKKASSKQMQARLADVPLFLPVFGRFLEHLTAHGINLHAQTMTLGPWLRTDTEKERFEASPAAHPLVRGTHRVPYTMSETDIPS